MNNEKLFYYLFVFDKNKETNDHVGACQSIYYIFICIVYLQNFNILEYKFSTN